MIDRRVQGSLALSVHPLSRRRQERIAAPQNVWAFWHCGRLEDTSAIRDIGVGGLFVETRHVCPLSATVELDFLVEDGAVRAKATVQHVQPGRGMGLHFQSLRAEDQTRFAAMLTRLSHLPRL